jgi:hypothetical protein
VKRLAALLAALALLALGVGYVYRHTTFRVEKVHTGFKPEAWRNPLLAAEFLLGKLGRHPVSRVGLPAEADGLQPADTVVMVDRERGFTPQEAERLLAFARSGGQVVVEVDVTQSMHGEVGEEARKGEHKAGHRALALRDHLLERLGADVIHVPWKPGDEGADKDADDEAKAAQAERRRRELWEPQLRLDEGAPFTVQVSPRWRLADAGRSGARLLGSPRSPVGLDYPVGAGRVRIFVDLDAWKNDQLVKLDHAEFLAWTLQDRPAEGRTWLVRGERTANLLDWLKANAWPALLALAGLVALVVWRGFARLGPVLPAPERARRSLLEHVDASGRLLWAEGQGGRMIRAARAALMRRLELAHPAWARLPLPFLSSRLADFADLPEPEVRRALFDDHHPDAASFRDALRTLERLRRSL